MIAAVHIDDIKSVDFIEVMFERPGGEDIGHAGIETRAEQGGESGFFEALLVSPLPGILKLRHILGLVVRGVHVIAAGGQAGIHQGEILIGQGHVDQQFRAGLADQGGGFLGIVGIHLGGGDGPAGPLFHGGGDGLAFRDGAGCEGDLPENLGDHGALVGDDIADSAGTDDKNWIHE